MSYKVLTTFTDSADGNHLYKENHKYPRANYKPTKERIELLSNPHKDYDGVIFIEKEEAPKKITKKE